MQLCIQQLYRIKLEVLFVLAFFCLANIYRTSLGKEQLGKPNPNQSKSLNFYLRRKKNILLRIECTTMFAARFAILILIYFLKNILKMYQKTCQNV